MVSGCNQWIAEQEEKMRELQGLLTSIPALSPENGGDGEFEKGAALVEWCRSQGLEEIEVLYAPDSRVSSGKRPNIILSLPGRNNNNKSLWIMSHLDIVPPGDLSKWDTDPFQVTEKEGKLYGRGTEDNQQGIVSSLFALLALKEKGIKPPLNVKLLFVADEEVGSSMGIQYLLREHTLFQKDDIFLVPDGGNEKGELIEVAEKSVLWLQFSLFGTQTHASRPDLGINTFLAAAELVLKLAALKEVYPQENKVFNYPYSSFSPTKIEANVPNVNTIPGKDVFCLDCRVLPGIPLDEVLEKINGHCRETEKDHGVRVSYEVLQRVESDPTPESSEIVLKLKKAVKDVYGIDAAPIGIGGGTVAAYLRNAGFDSVVWARLDERAHDPNEYCKVENMIGDAQVMAALMTEEQ